MTLLNRHWRRITRYWFARVTYLSTVPWSLTTWTQKCCMHADSSAMLTCLLTVIFCLSSCLRPHHPVNSCRVSLTPRTCSLYWRTVTIWVAKQRTYKEDLQVSRQSYHCALLAIKACDLIFNNDTMSWLWTTYPDHSKCSTTLTSTERLKNKCDSRR